MKLEPKDIIAVLIIVGIGFMKFKGFNGSLDTLIAVVVTYYFVKRNSGIDNGK